MLKRDQAMLWAYDGPAPAETRQLEADGHCLIRGVFRGEELRALRAEILAVYAQYPVDGRVGRPEEAELYRYEMFNRSALCQRAIANPRLLEVMEPLVGGDCHAINCTAWRNLPGRAADPTVHYWHVDGGPHVPRRADVDWPDSIPYPIFVIATHIYLDDCELDDGPTTVVPGSHRSGRPPPSDRRFDPALEYRGRGPVTHVARAGDIGCFVSDVWHRRTPPTVRSRGRFFLQTNYGRRDIAQRIFPTALVNHASDAARARAATPREQQLIGLHDPSFYDG